MPRNVNVDDEWDEIAPSQRGCFRPLVNPQVNKSRSSGASVTSARTPSAKSTVFPFGGTEKSKLQVKTIEEYGAASMERKLISNSQRSKSVPPASRRQKSKTIVYRDEPGDSKRNTKTKSSVSTTSDDTDALLGGGKKILRKKSDDDYDDWMERPYSPPSKDQILWVHPSFQPNNNNNNNNTQDSSKRSEEKTPFKKQQSVNTTNQLADTSMDISSADHASAKSKSSVFQAFSKWKSSESKNSTPTHKQNAKVHSNAISSSKSSMDGTKDRRHGAAGKYNRNPLTTDTDHNSFDLADLLSENLKQMERDMQDIHNKKYANHNSAYRQSNEQDYFHNKQLVHEQDEILERKQKNIPAEIALKTDGLDKRLFLARNDDGDSVSELGNESVTPKLNTSGLTLVYTDRAQRSNYMNDIDDTVQIKDDTPFSPYHAHGNVDRHMSNRVSRKEVVSDYGSRRTKSKSLTRFDNRGLPDISLVDSDSDMIDDELSTPLHSKGLSLTEAFNEFDLDDRIKTSRRSRSIDKSSARIGEYDQRMGINNTIRTTQRGYDIIDQKGTVGQNMGRRVQTTNNYLSMDYGGASAMESLRSSNSSDKTVLNRILASRALRSNKYIEAGGAVTLKRDHTNSYSDRHSEEKNTRHPSTKRLPKGSFPTHYDRSIEYAESMDEDGGGYGSRPSRRMMRSLQTN